MASPITKAAKSGAKTIRRAARPRQVPPGDVSANLGYQPADARPAVPAALEPLAAREARFPRFTNALKHDARMFAAGRGERYEFRSRADLVTQALRLAWESDAFLAWELYRAKAAMQAKGIPFLPGIAHRLSMSLAQVSVGDAVIVAPGIYVPHGQIVLDGQTEIGANCDLRPWCTVGPRSPREPGPILEKGVSLGTGSQIIGPITLGTRALVGANASVTTDVPAHCTAVGNPAKILDPRRKAPAAPKVDPDQAAAAAEAGAQRARAKMRATLAPIVDAAKAAESEGRYFDALALITAANRFDRQTAFDRDLVRLRHEAFLSLDRAPGRDSWPPTMADPFPDLVAQTPEITASELTTEVMGGSILHHGCVIVRGLVPDSVATVLRDDIEKAFNAVDAEPGAGLGKEVMAYFHPFMAPEPYEVNIGERGWVRAAGGVLAADSPPTLFDLTEAFATAGVPAILEGYLGERPAFSINKSTLRRSIDAQPSFHQDGSFLGEGVRTVNIWLALSHCGGDTNTVGIDLVPRRFDDLLETGTHGSMFPNSIGPDLVATFYDETPLLTPLFAPGDAIIFDERFVHRTSVKEGLTENRYAIESWFFAPSAFPPDYSPLIL